MYAKLGKWKLGKLLAREMGTSYGAIQEKGVFIETSEKEVFHFGDYRITNSSDGVKVTYPVPGVFEGNKEIRKITRTIRAK